MLVDALFVIDQKLEAAKMSASGLLDKQTMVQSYNGILLCSKRKCTIKSQTDRQDLGCLVQAKKVHLKGQRTVQRFWGSAQKS